MATKGLSKDDLYALSEDLLGAWNSQKVEEVVARYTDDLVYLDPNTRGEISSPEAMARYLGKLFANWKMHWTLKDAFPFAQGDGCAALWRASFRKPDGEVTVEADGMDLVLIEGSRIKRNEVYFDRAVLAPLM